MARTLANPLRRPCSCKAPSERNVANDARALTCRRASGGRVRGARGCLCRRCGVHRGWRRSRRGRHGECRNGGRHSRCLGNRWWNRCWRSGGLCGRRLWRGRRDYRHLRLLNRLRRRHHRRLWLLRASRERPDPYARYDDHHGARGDPEPLFRSRLRERGRRLDVEARRPIPRRRDGGDARGRGGPRRRTSWFKCGRNRPWRCRRPLHWPLRNRRR
jgi:hypothetical protein